MKLCGIGVINHSPIQCNLITWSLNFFIPFSHFFSLSLSFTTIIVSYQPLIRICFNLSRLAFLTNNLDVAVVVGSIALHFLPSFPPVFLQKLHFEMNAHKWIWSSNGGVSNVAFLFAIWSKQRCNSNESPFILCTVIPKDFFLPQWYFWIERCLWDWFMWLILTSAI